MNQRPAFIVAVILIASFVWIPTTYSDTSSDQAPTPAPPPPVPPATQRASAETEALLPCCLAPEAGAEPTEPTADTPAPLPSSGNATMESPSPAASARAGEWLSPDQREAFDLDFQMTNQDGTALKLSDLAGSPMAISFIFTRCPSPNMCPLIVQTMAHLQHRLDEAGLAGKAKLLLITYDPVFDTPERLKPYGEDRGLVFNDDTTMLRPDPDLFREFLHEFQVGVNYNADGSIGHFIELLLVDRQGRFVRDYHGRIWNNDAVLADLKTLIAEPVLAATPIEP